MTAWTDAKVKLLTAGWKAGLETTVLSRQLGMSASAISSKRHHLGLPSRSADAIAEQRRRNGEDHARKVTAPPLAVARPDTFLPLRGSTPRPLVLRLFGECAFPVDGPTGETLSCCLPIAPLKGPYCLGHQTILRGGVWPPEDPPPEDLEKWT